MSLANVAYTSKAFIAARLLVRKGENFFYVGEIDTVVTIQKWLGKAYNDLAQTAWLHIAEKAGRLVQSSYLRAVNFDEFMMASRPVNFSARELKGGFYQRYADFLKNENMPIAFQFEQRKKVRIVKSSSDNDTSLLRNGWGFVENGILYVRNGEFYIPMQPSLGSFSGLGMCFTETAKVPLTGLLLQNPFIVIADMADIAISGPVAKMEHYRLFKLNTETGNLE